MVQWPDAAGSPRNRGDPAGGREPAAALPVQYVNRPNLDFRGFSGTVASGTVQVGQRLKVLPSGVESSVARIVTFDGDLQEPPPAKPLPLC